MKTNVVDTWIVVSEGKSKAPTYMVCSSRHPFVKNSVVSHGTNTSPDHDDENNNNSKNNNNNNNNHNVPSAREVNATLNLNLGLCWILNPDIVWLRKVCQWIQILGIMWWEEWLFAFIKKLPVSFRRRVCLTGWYLYFHWHKASIGRRSGIHRDASEEYHALTTLLYWGRFFPVTIPRMRFCLSQISAWTNHHVTSHVDRISYVVMPGTNPNGWSQSVKGLYVHSSSSHGNHDDESHGVSLPVTSKVIYWLYGGAFLSGDVDGNLAPADMVGVACHMDVFLVSYSLIPEAKFDEIVWGVCLAYQWLVTIRQVNPSDIILYGISSGAGLATRLMQFIAKKNRGDDVDPSIVSQILSPMPRGAVLMCPFVDYTEPDPDGSFLQYTRHDLIVNQSVMEIGLPYLDSALESRRRESSPCYDDCHDLPPLCVIVSEHETVYDQTLLLVNRAREQGVTVTLGVWKYLCHVFCFLAAFCPEGKQAIDFGNDWIRQSFNEN
jgi:epsilon-lactone hydrolase